MNTRLCRLGRVLLLSAALTGCVTAPVPDSAASKAESDRKIDDIVQTYSKRIAEIDASADRRDAARAAEQKAICDKKGGVAVGMTRAQVYASCWGKPQRINITTNAGGKHEQLVYPGFQYVYLQNGVVASIQTRR